MELKPPFEVEVAKYGRLYVLDCEPNEVAKGSFKPHLVIRSAETRKVLTFMNIAGSPLSDVSKAAGIAYQAGDDWIERQATVSYSANDRRHERATPGGRSAGRLYPDSARRPRAQRGAIRVSR